MSSTFDPIEFERKWQERWEASDAFSSERRPGTEKFYIIFAYPGISGYLHVGHMRGFTYADVLARYNRMLGRAVLFPAGFHASGLPATSLAKRVARGDTKTIEYLRKNGCLDPEIEKLGDSDEVIRYFSHIYIENYWKKFGFTIDFQRAMTTISPGYKRFIEWQFRKLKERNLLIHKPHVAPFCPVCGPVAVDASMTDVSKGGGAQVMEFTALKFRDDEGNIYPAATLRPETVFGVTNMWLNPSVTYRRIRVDGESWVVSPEAAVKLSYQRENGIEEIGDIRGTELIGRELIVPVTGRRVPVLPGDFVDPAVATGVVMSVPTHAPFDWAALVDVKKNAEALAGSYGIDAGRVRAIEVVTLIHTSKSRSDNPARDLCERLNVTSQNDHEALEQATQEIYKAEFHSGVLNDNCREYSGLRVSQVKDTLRKDFIDRGIGVPFFEFSEPVVCRCDTPVLIKRVPKQWFIRYSDEELTTRTKDHARGMNIVPKEYYNEMPNVLDWFSDRACIRQGSWLGTGFPFEKGWTIEPISDSTLYPAYYIVSKYVNMGVLEPSEMDERFFDHIFLGIGNPEEWDVPGERVELYREIKADFDYWYPLDINLGGKEHKTVHFPVFLMNHVAVLPENKWPRGIFVNWWVTMSGGEKIAKSKGGAEPIPRAIERYGVDAMRLYYCHVGSAQIDIEWEQKVVLHYRARIKRIWELVTGTLAQENDLPGKDMDEWLRLSFREGMFRIMDQFRSMDMRNATNEIYFNAYQIFQWYMKRGGGNRTLLLELYRDWIKTMAPFTPHVAEEMWETCGNKGFVSLEHLPEPSGAEPDREPLYREEFLRGVLTDVKNILGLLGDPSAGKVVIYTAPVWKRQVLEKVLEIKREEPEAKSFDLGKTIKELLSREEMAPHRKDLPRYLGSLAKGFAGISDEEIERSSLDMDEAGYLLAGRDFLEREIGHPIEIYRAGESDVPDPEGKSKQAQPGRPAIYVGS